MKGVSIMKQELMKQELMRLIQQFGSNLSSHEYNQYIPKLRDYFIDYLLENKPNVSNVEYLFKYEFTRNDIIKSTGYYVIENPNVKSKSAIDDFLISLNRFFDSHINEKYPNQNLIALRPFNNLSSDIETYLLEKGIKLEERTSFPPIDENQYLFILNYIKAETKKSPKNEEVSIILKLLLLYGFSFDKIISLEREDYCFDTRTLEVKYMENPKRCLKLELPDALNKDISSYVNSRDKKTCKSRNLFVTREGNKITQSFPADFLNKVRKEYYLENNLENNLKNPFTNTGLAKYAVINMILNGVNQSVIYDLTGFKEDMYKDCQNKVNELKRLNRDRYINHMIRGISTYDEINN
jgi:integrase